MLSRHEIRIGYSTITEESAAEGDHADNGWYTPEHDRVGVDASDESIRWGLRDALQFMQENNQHVETCWTPGDNGRGTGFGHSWFSGTGNPDDCEGDEIEVCYDLFIKHVSDGTATRLARLMAANGVHFANVRSLQRRRAG